MTRRTESLGLFLGGYTGGVLAGINYGEPLGAAAALVSTTIAGIIFFRTAT